MKTQLGRKEEMIDTLQKKVMGMNTQLEQSKDKFMEELEQSKVKNLIIRWKLLKRFQQS